MNFKKILNKALSSVCCVAMVATLLPALPTAAEGKVFFEDNFSDYTAGEFTKEVAASHGYALIPVTGTPDVSVVKEGSEQFLQIAAQRPFIRIPGPSGAYTMSFDLMRNGSNSGLFEIWIADLVSDSSQNIRFRVHDNGAVGFVNSKTSKNYYAQSGGGFSEGGYNSNRTDSGNLLLDVNTWYTVEFTMVPGSAMDLKVSKRGSSTALFEDTAILDDFQSRAFIQLDGQDFNGNSINVSIDNVKVTSAAGGSSTGSTPSTGGTTGGTTVTPTTGNEFAVQSFESYDVDAGFDGDDAFTLSVIAEGGEAKRVVKEEEGNKYLLMSAQNTASSTGTVRNRMRTKSTIGGTYTVEWDVNNYSGARVETYLRHGGSVRVRVMNHKIYLGVESDAVVKGSMESVASKVAMKDNKWYTFKTEVSNQKITLSVYDKSNNNALVDTISINQDASAKANLLDPYNIWFDLWGLTDKGDTTMQSVGLDNICITQGTYEGVKSAPHDYETVSDTPSGGSSSVQATEVVSENYQSRTGGDRISSDDKFTVSSYENGGALSREVRTISGNKYMQMTAWNTDYSTAAPRVQVKTQEKVSGTFTVEWDYNNVSSGRGQYFETYLRTGGNIRVRIDDKGIPRIRVLAAVAVPGVMEDSIGTVALKTNNWYTFKAVVSNEKIVVDIYDKDNGNAKVETLEIVQDASKDPKLLDAYNIWFDLWGKQDVNDQTPAAVAVDNFHLYRGTYEGTKNSQIQTPAAVAVSDSEKSEGAVMVKCASGLEHCPAEDMIDIGKYAWYHKAVDYALTNKLMGGYNFYTFGPYDTLTRAMVAQVLYNKEGQPKISGKHGFADVAAGQWYNNAVTWAVQNKVMGGYNASQFGPEDNVTVEQIAVILWNYSGNPTFKGNADSVGAHSSWAANALSWAVENGILNGMPYDAVTDPANRAQTAQMLMNYLNK